MNLTARTTTDMYLLEPGDATRYIMMLTQPKRYIISGLGEFAEEFTTVSILMSRTGVATLRKRSLIAFAENPSTDYVVGYARSHGLRDVDPYTRFVCLAAAGVLVESPTALDKAEEAMRRAAEVYSEKV